MDVVDPKYVPKAGAAGGLGCDVESDCSEVQTKGVACVETGAVGEPKIPDVEVGGCGC